MGSRMSNVWIIFIWISWGRYSCDWLWTEEGLWWSDCNRRLTADGLTGSLSGVSVLWQSIRWADCSQTDRTERCSGCTGADLGELGPRVILCSKGAGDISDGVLTRDWLAGLTSSLSGMCVWEQSANSTDCSQTDCSETSSDCSQTDCSETSTDCFVGEWLGELGLSTPSCQGSHDSSSSPTSHGTLTLI